MNSNRYRQVGLSLLEVMLSASLMSVGLVGINQMVESYVIDTKNTAVAEQLKTSAEAYRAYIRNNYGAIMAVATGDQPYLITHTDLSLGSYLPPGSNGRTAYGQTICALVRKNGSGTLEALVVTEGGAVIDNFNLSGIVGMTGSSAGALYSNEGSQPKSTEIVGPQNSWRLPVAVFDNRTNHVGKKCTGSTDGNVRIAVGHPVVALWFENAFVQGSAIYRDAVPGSPHLNEMNTPLVMNSVQPAGSQCDLRGAIARDASGLVQTCAVDAANTSRNIWTRTANSLFWGDPVASVELLPSCIAAIKGATRLVTAVAAPALAPSVYSCDGEKWSALSVDASGNLSVPGVLSAGSFRPTGVVTWLSACTNAGDMAVASDGLLMICRLSPQEQLIWTKGTAGSLSCHVIIGQDLNTISIRAGESACQEGHSLMNAPNNSNDWFFVTTQRHGNSDNPLQVQTAINFFSGKIYTRSQVFDNWTAWSESINAGSGIPARNIRFKTCSDGTGTPHAAEYTCSLPLDTNSQWVVYATAKFLTHYESDTNFYLDNNLLSATRVNDVGAAVDFSHSAVSSKICGLSYCEVVAKIWYHQRHGAANFIYPNISMIAFRLH